MTLIRKMVLISGLAICFSATSHAEGLYGTAMVGITFQDTDAKAYGNNIALDVDFPSQFDAGDGELGTFGLGYAFNENYRLEARLGYHKSDFGDRQIGTGARDGEEYILDGEFESTTFTIEGFYDIPTGTSFVPYLKAGVGVSNNEYSARLGGTGVAGFDAFDGTVDGFYDAYADGDSTEMTWNVGLGGSYSINDKWSVFAEYQYMDFGSVSTGQDAFTDGFGVDATANEIAFGIGFDF